MCTFSNKAPLASSLTEKQYKLLNIYTNKTSKPQKQNNQQQKGFPYVIAYESDLS